MEAPFDGLLETSRFNLVSRSLVDEDGVVDKRSGYEIRNVCQSISLVEGKAIAVFIATTISVNFLEVLR